ncbi:hypothetical protein ACPF8X_07740 [Streptomyces sp. G35A]
MLRPVDAPEVEIAPGVTAHHTPGHTPGHYMVRIADGGREAYLLGDAVHHPLQLNDTGISFLSDTDAEHALKTREELLARLAGRDVVIGMDHFPGLAFQRITVGEDGRTWTDAGGPPGRRGRTRRRTWPTAGTPTVALRARWRPYVGPVGVSHVRPCPVIGGNEG